VATLYKRGESYYLNWCEAGQQFRRSLGKLGRREAETVRAEKEAELSGLITLTRGVTMGAILRDYLHWYATARAGTHKRAESALRRFIERFEGVPAEGCPAEMIEAWIAEQTATGQAEKALKLARAAFRRAVLQRRIARSPMDGITIPKGKISRAPDYYRPEELGRLADTPRGHLWLFMAHTGVRRGEMAKARRSDLRNGLLYVESTAEGRTKNLRWRAVPLTDAARTACERLGGDLLVKCHPDTLSDWFAADARTVGLRGTLHWLRHTFCTGLVQAGVSLHEVKRLAGHSSITVTERYAHHAPGYGADAIARLSAWSSTPDSTDRP
jgi:integrase